VAKGDSLLSDLPPQADHTKHGLQLFKVVFVRGHGATEDCLAEA